MDEKRASVIWKEIINTAKSKNQDRQPGEITIRDFMAMVLEDTGRSITRSQARDVLEAKVQAKQLTVRRLYVKEVHSTCNLYRVNEESLNETEGE